MKAKYPVIIIGAGLAGLTAAKTLHESNTNFLLIDAAAEVGGRVQTEVIDGYLLDKGFQVLLTSYEEAQNQFNYGSLELASFIPGALVRKSNAFHYVADPLRVPSSIISTLKAPVGSLRDKIKLGLLSLQSKKINFSSNKETENITALQALHNEGFSDSMIDYFFKPFFSGVFLDQELSVRADFFYYLFKKFGSGLASLPKHGISALPKQLVGNLPQDSLRLSTKVKSLNNKTVILDDNSHLEAESIILAVNRESVEKLMNLPKSENRETTCFYFESSGLDWIKNRLVVNASGNGNICNLCVPNLVQTSYAPQNKQLLSVSTLKDIKSNSHSPEQIIRQELKLWFGSKAENFKHIKTYRIKNALPKIWGDDSLQNLNSNFIYCGDYTEQPSIQGALSSGGKAALKAISKLT